MDHHRTIFYIALLIDNVASLLPPSDSREVIRIFTVGTMLTLTAGNCATRWWELCFVLFSYLYSLFWMFSEPNPFLTLGFILQFEFRQWFWPPERAN